MLSSAVMTDNEKFIVVNFLIFSHISLSLPFMGAFHVSVDKCYVIFKGTELFFLHNRSEFRCFYPGEIGEIFLSHIPGPRE